MLVQVLIFEDATKAPNNLHPKNNCPEIGTLPSQRTPNAYS
jgi:hypothetical protein